MSTRTKDPDSFIDGARRDRCAIVAEAARARGVHARACRVAGCATSNGSAGHAGAQASFKLTFQPDHLVGADQA